MEKITRIQNRIDELVAYQELCSEGFGFCTLSDKEIEDIIERNHPEYQQEIKSLEGLLTLEQLD